MFPWGPVISAGASLIGGLVSARGAERASDRSEDFSREMYNYALLNGPTMEMEGLRRAGINPMLRYGTGGQGTPVSMPTMSFGNQFGELGSGIAGAASSAFGTMKIEQEVEESRGRTRSMLERLPHEIANIEADTNLTTQDRFHRFQQMRLLVLEQAATEARTRLSEQEFTAFSQRMAALDAQRVASLAAAAASSANAALSRANAGLSEAALSRASYDEQWYDSWFGEIMRGVGLTVDSVTGGSTPLVGR